MWRCLAVVAARRRGSRGGGRAINVTNRERGEVSRLFDLRHFACGVYACPHRHTHAHTHTRPTDTTALHTRDFTHTTHTHTAHTHTHETSSHLGATQSAHPPATKRRPAPAPAAPRRLAALRCWRGGALHGVLISGRLEREHRKHHALHARTIESDLVRVRVKGEGGGDGEGSG